MGRDGLFAAKELKIAVDRPILWSNPRQTCRIWGPFLRGISDQLHEHIELVAFKTE